jgi:UDP-N-acetylglucosamine--N-acetylmuramyl-(pentapeptide) pyrophosphoryl-undecaprenol N-acetylglucosamine transferase
MSDAPLVVFAGGATGGHLYPNLAVASALETMVEDVRFVFFGTRRPIDRRITSEAGRELVAQSVRPLFLRKPWSLPRFAAAWFGSRRACRAHLREHRPVAVIGSGGYASGPIVREASRAGVPTALLNPDAVPGRANRYLARRVDVIFAQWEESVQHFNGHAGVKVTGCPVRREFRTASREAGLERFELDPACKTLLVTGASQGARTINDAMIAIASVLRDVPGWQVLHITGDADVRRVADAYAAHSVPARTVSFTEHMAEALAAADLVVSRSGASILAEITALGRPSVLMPYPYHGDRHQEANARVLVKRGAARMVRDQADAGANGPALRGVLVPLMEDAQELSRLASTAQRLGRADAACEIANEVIALSRGALVAKKNGGWRENES